MSDSTLNTASNPDSTENKDLENSSNPAEIQKDPKADEGSGSPSEQKDPPATSKKTPANKSDENKATGESVTKTKEITLHCKYAQVRIGNEYFSPDHEGNITVPSHLADEAKKVCGE